MSNFDEKTKSLSTRHKAVLILSIIILGSLLFFIFKFKEAAKEERSSAASALSINGTENFTFAQKGTQGENATPAQKENATVKNIVLAGNAGKNANSSEGSRTSQGEASQASRASHASEASSSHEAVHNENQSSSSLPSGGKATTLPSGVNATASANATASTNATTANATNFTNSTTSANGTVFNAVISEGDTMGVILEEWLPLEDVNTVIDISKPVFPLTKIRAGNEYTIVSNEGGFCRFEYSIDNTCKLVVNKDSDRNRFFAKIEQTPYTIQLEHVEFGINSSLFQAVADAGESPGLAIALADMFGYEVNFIKDLREGDTFSVLMEKRYQKGQFKSYGKILAAYFINQGKKHEGFYFAEGASGTYFGSNGLSLKRAFLKAPLPFTRISSGYNLKRLHPIFKEVRPHPAVDYAAPSGTPVKAIGGGKVKFVGWGKGAGKYIELAHNSSYESSYMHLSRFAKGLKKGASVRQGEVIGYVGSTGYATGPHLDFRMKKSGNYINPSSVTSPRSEPIAARKKTVFTKQVAQYRNWLDGKEALSTYPTDGLFAKK